MKNLARFATVLFALLPLSVLLSHLFELPGKVILSKEAYHVVQTIYNEFPWLFILEIIALALTVLLAIWERKKKRMFILLLISGSLFLMSIAIFFIYVLPIYMSTGGWSILPENWEDLRIRWEYANATRASLNLVGFSLIILALLRNRYYYPLGLNV